jgi:hypothetical protein
MVEKHDEKHDEKRLEKPDESPDPGRWMRRLGRDEFSRLMGASIETTLERRGGFTPGEARRLRWEALRRFAGLLNRRTRRVRALTRSEHLRELERTHGFLLRERVRQVQEIAGLEQELAQARGDHDEAVLTVAEEAALERELSADLRALLASASPEAEMVEVLGRERVRRATALAVVVARERERIDQLERRLAKLCKAQAQMELAMAELARRAQLDGGLPSIYQQVQGLAADAIAREAKGAMLAQIFEQNLILQKPLEALDGHKKTA